MYTRITKPNLFSSLMSVKMCDSCWQISAFMTSVFCYFFWFCELNSLRISDEESNMWITLASLTIIYLLAYTSRWVSQALIHVYLRSGETTAQGWLETTLESILFFSDSNSPEQITPTSSATPADSTWEWEVLQSSSWVSFPSQWTLLKPTGPMPRSDLGR